MAGDPMSTCRTVMRKADIIADVVLQYMTVTMPSSAYTTRSTPDGGTPGRLPPARLAPSTNTAKQK